MMTAIVAIIGIISTLVSWFFNPKRIIYSQLDSVYLKLEGLYVKRDEALLINDSDALTTITGDILRLCKTKNILLQRLR